MALRCEVPTMSIMEQFSASTDTLFRPGRYPDRIAAHVPRGFRSEVRRAAEAEGLSLAEFVRQAIEGRLARRIAGAAR